MPIAARKPSKRAPAPEDVLVSPSEVARRFEVSTQTVSKWRKRGLLPYVETSSGWKFYRSSDVDRLWEQRQEERVAKAIKAQALKAAG